MVVFIMEKYIKAYINSKFLLDKSELKSKSARHFHKALDMSRNYLCFCKAASAAKWVLLNVRHDEITAKINFITSSFNFNRLFWMLSAFVFQTQSNKYDTFAHFIFDFFPVSRESSKLSRILIHDIEFKSFEMHWIFKSYDIVVIDERKTFVRQK